MEPNDSVKQEDVKSKFDKAKIKKYGRNAGILTILAGLGYLLGKNNNNDQQDIQQLLQQPQPNTTNKLTKKQAKKQPIRKSTLQQQDNSLDALMLAQLGALKQIDELSKAYSELVAKHELVIDNLAKKLDKLNTLSALFTAKTPFANYTDADLFDKVKDAYMNMPFAEASKTVSGIIKGYYLARMHNLDTSELSAIELRNIAENPAFAKGLAERPLILLEKVSESLQFQYNTKIKELGAIKDVFKGQIEAVKTKLQTLSEFTKNLITANHYKAMELLKGRELSIRERELSERAKLWEAQAEYYRNKDTSGGLLSNKSSGLLPMQQTTQQQQQIVEQMLRTD